MEEQLRRTTEAVGALRALLSGATAVTAVEYRTVPAVAALAVSATVALTELSEWCTTALAELAAALRERGVRPSGHPAGCTRTAC
jgi:hypothetical protein